MQIRDLRDDLFNIYYSLFTETVTGPYRQHPAVVVATFTFTTQTQLKTIQDTQT